MTVDLRLSRRKREHRKKARRVRTRDNRRQLIVSHCSRPSNHLYHLIVPACKGHKLHSYAAHREMYMRKSRLDYMKKFNSKLFNDIHGIFKLKYQRVFK